MTLRLGLALGLAALSGCSRGEARFPQEPMGPPQLVQLRIDAPEPVQLTRLRRGEPSQPLCVAPCNDRPVQVDSMDLFVLEPAGTGGGRTGRFSLYNQPQPLLLGYQPEDQGKKGAGVTLTAIGTTGMVLGGGAFAAGLVWAIGGAFVEVFSLGGANVDFGPPGILILAGLGTAGLSAIPLALGIPMLTTSNAKVRLGPDPYVAPPAPQPPPVQLSLVPNGVRLTW